MIFTSFSSWRRALALGAFLGFSLLAAATAPDLGPLRGLVIVDDPAKVVATGRPGIQGVDVTQAGGLADAGLVARLQPLLGQPMDTELLPSIRRVVADYQAAKGPALVRVVLPVQDVRDGVLQLVLARAKIGTVAIEGEKWFKESRYRAALGVQPGDNLDPAKLNAGVDRINANAYRRATAQLAPGVEIGATDVTLRVEDRLPLGLSAGYNDTGTISTGAGRAFAGITWGDAFGRGDTLGYNFTTTPGTRVLRSHAVNYGTTLPWGDHLSFNGSSARMNSILPPPFNQSAKSSSLNLRYDRALPALGSVSQGFSLSADYKRSARNLLFSNVPVFGTLTEVVQAIVDYQASRRDPHGATSLGLSLTLSPGGLAPHNQTTDFRAQRAEASARYAYASLTLGRQTRLPAKFSLTNTLRLQASTDNLLGSEQLSLGGASVLRGYEEGEVYADEGLILSNQLELPAIAFGRERWAGQVRPHVFWDYGYGLVKDPLPGEKDRFSLSSVGVGLRLGVSRHANVGFDYGWQLIETGLNSHGRSNRGHLNATLSW